MTRRLISSGGRWEATVGYSRAIVVGDTCWVAGTTDAGFALTDVVRTRMFVTDISRSAEIGAVHSEIFGLIRPAATMVEVRALMAPSLLIEIEVGARQD